MKRFIVWLWLFALVVSCAVDSGSVGFDDGGATGGDGGMRHSAGGTGARATGGSLAGGAAGNNPISGNPGVSGNSGASGSSDGLGTGGASGSASTTRGGNDGASGDGGAPSEVQGGSSGDSAGVGGSFEAGAGGESGQSGGTEGVDGGSGGLGENEGGSGGAAPINPCAPNPCQNQGTCSADGDEYECTCTDLWIGPECNTPNPCLQPTNPCSNGGTCSLTNTGYSCACPDAYRGSTCEFRKFRGLGVGYPRALSGNGRFLVGEYCDNAGVCLAARADADQANSIGQLPAPSDPPHTFDDCFGFAVNTTGDWVGGYCSGLDGYFGITWTASASTRHLAGPSAAEPLVAVNDVSGDGTIAVGGYNTTVAGSSVQRAFRRTTASGVVSLGVLTGRSDSVAQVVSTDGQTVAGQSGGFPFRWHPSGGMVALPAFPSAVFHSVVGISDDGNTIVGLASPGGASQVVRWVNGGQPQDLGTGSLAGISADGSVVVGALNDSTGPRVWGRTGAPTALLTLLAAPPADTAGWTDLVPRAVSNDGKVVVGTGTHNGQQEVWVAHLP